MKPPYLLTRLTGSPFVALLLFGLYGAVIFGWSQGRVPMFLAVIAGLFAIATGNSVIEVRHYNRWMAGWESMGQMSAEELEAQRRKPSWLSILAAVALLVFIPTRHFGADETVASVYVITWLLSGLYLVVALFNLARGRGRSYKAERPAQPVEATAAPVEFMMGRPSSSPSFDDAARNLPDYAAAMLQKRRDEHN